MKKTLAIIVVFIITACQSETKPQLKTEKIIEPAHIKTGEYKLIGENLFQDKMGNLYFRTLDRSALNEDKEVYAIYSNRLYFDTIIANDSTYLELELKDIVDPLTFKKIKKDNQATTYYRDKKHDYFHREMAYGGTLHCIK